MIDCEFLQQQLRVIVILEDIARRKDYAIPRAELTSFFQQQK
jgi:hypothetical protein